MALVRASLGSIFGFGVYILSEEEWGRRMSGEQSLEPVGFPLLDVFVYDDRAKTGLGKDEVEWQTLTPFVPDDKIAA